MSNMSETGALEVCVVLGHSGHGESTHVVGVYVNRDTAVAWLKVAGCRQLDGLSFVSRDERTYYCLSTHLIEAHYGLWLGAREVCHACGAGCAYEGRDCRGRVSAEEELHLCRRHTTEHLTDVTDPC